MPDRFGEPAVTNSCAFFTAHEAAGASGTRYSLRPLILEGDFSKLGRDLRPGNAEAHLYDVIPGCAARRRPGIHNHIALAACRIREKEESSARLVVLREWPKGQARRGLWIPGSPFGRPGMTTRLFD